MRLGGRRAMIAPSHPQLSMVRQCVLVGLNRSGVSFANLAADLPAIWRAPTTDARLKKRIVRSVIEEVVADIDAEAGEISLFLHWVGGVHTELRLPRRRRGQRNATSPDIIEAIRLLVRIACDDVIVGVLNRNKLAALKGEKTLAELAQLYDVHP